MITKAITTAKQAEAGKKCKKRKRETKLWMRNGIKHEYLYE